jgi:hypothetical protein
MTGADVEMICARCGTSRQPIGPRLSLDGWGRASLRYACHGCGYGWVEPAPDGERADQIVRLPVRQPDVERGQRSSNTQFNGAGAVGAEELYRHVLSEGPTGISWSLGDCDDLGAVVIERASVEAAKLRFNPKASSRQ